MAHAHLGRRSEEQCPFDWVPFRGRPGLAGMAVDGSVSFPVGCPLPPWSPDLARAQHAQHLSVG